jgi:hypothetical protein
VFWVHPPFFCLTRLFALLLVSEAREHAFGNTARPCEARGALGCWSVEPMGTCDATATATAPATAATRGCWFDDGRNIACATYKYSASRAVLFCSKGFGHHLLQKVGVWVLIFFFLATADAGRELLWWQWCMQQRAAVSTWSGTQMRSRSGTPPATSGDRGSDLMTCRTLAASGDSPV